MEWQEVAEAQAGLITRRQLSAAGISPHAVAHRVGAERWQLPAPDVVATFTGTLSTPQRLWLGALHGGPAALVSGVHAASRFGLTGWDRPVVTILVPYRGKVPSPLEGFRFVRSRRDLKELRSERLAIPACKFHVALLLFAADKREGERSAIGILAAAVQQRLTTAAVLLERLELMLPLRRAAVLRQALADIAGGAQSMAEVDLARVCRRFGLRQPARQVKRRDAGGVERFTDAEWRRADGQIVVLEVDGGFHLEVGQWQDDIARQRALSEPGRIIVRCTARELRDSPARVVADLTRLGVPRSGGAEHEL